MNNQLLSNQDFADIRDALNDTMFTFFKRPIIYRKDSDTITRFQRDVATNREFTNYELLGLIVWTDTDTKAETVQRQTGAHDFTEGYCLLRYDDCQAAGIIDAQKRFITTPPQDRLNFNSTEYYVNGMLVIGQLNNDEVLVKVWFRKDLKNG